MDDALNWDDAKAAENSRRHGLSFQQGAKALHDSFAVEWIDDREHYGEERVNLLVLRMIQISQLTPPPRFPGESRDPLLPWAPAFAGEARCFIAH